MSSNEPCCGCHNSSSSSLNSVSDVDTDSVCRACYAFHTVNKEIAESTDPEALVRLKKHRYKSSTSVNDRHDLLTLKLPLEVCTMIFELLTADKSMKRTGVFTLGRVCKKWRNITISTAALWTTISFVLDLARGQPANEGNIIITEILKRSCQSALTVTIIAVVPRYPPKNADEKLDLFEVILKTLCSASSRFKWLKFQGPDQFRTFLANNQNAPMLERLLLQGANWHRHRPFYDPVKGKAWNVAALMYYGASGVHNIVEEPILWGNLTKLTGCYGTMVEYVEVLRMTPNLTQLSLLQQSGYKILPELLTRAKNPVTHETLQELTVELEQGRADTLGTARAMAVFLNNVTLPSLTELAVHVAPDFEEEPSNGLIEFLQRSKCQLSGFGLLFSGRSNAFDLEQVLKLVPTVEIFHFIDDSPEAFCQLLEILASTKQILLQDNGEPVPGSCLPQAKTVNVSLHFEAWIPNEGIIPDVFPHKDDPKVPNSRYRPLVDLAIKRLNTSSKLLIQPSTVRRWAEVQKQGFYFEVVSQAGEGAEEIEHVTESWDWYKDNTFDGVYNGRKPVWALWHL